MTDTLHLPASEQHLQGPVINITALPQTLNQSYFLYSHFRQLVYLNLTIFWFNIQFALLNRIRLSLLQYHQFSTNVIAHSLNLNFKKSNTSAFLCVKKVPYTHKSRHSKFNRPFQFLLLHPLYIQMASHIPQN